MFYNEIEIVESFKNLTKNIITYFENNLFGDSSFSCSEHNVIGTILQNEGNKMNITELASILKMSKSAVSQSVSKLEKKGYVKRKINLLDKKINYLVLTEKAKEEYAIKRKEYHEMILKVSDGMGEQDSKELSRLLEKLSNIINCLGKEHSVC